MFPWHSYQIQFLLSLYSCIQWFSDLDSLLIHEKALYKCCLYFLQKIMSLSNPVMFTACFHLFYFGVFLYTSGLCWWVASQFVCETWYSAPPGAGLWHPSPSIPSAGAAPVARVSQIRICLGLTQEIQWIMTMCASLPYFLKLS